MLVRYCCKLFESINATVSSLLSKNGGNGRLLYCEGRMILSGMCSTATEAKG